MRHLPAFLLLIASLTACAADDTDVEDETSTEAQALKFPPDEDPPDPPDCDDGNPCTTDWFNRFCRHTRLADGTYCDEDGDVCNGSKACSAGACVATSGPIVCDDGNSCTTDRCDSWAGGCVFEDAGVVCSDGNACTVADACVEGACVGLGSTSGDVVAPTITDVAYSAPVPMLERGGVVYLAGDLADVELTLSSCSYVTRVELGGALLTTAPRTACGEFDYPRDCEPRFYSIEEDTVLADGSRRMRLRFHLLPAAGNGASLPVHIQVSSALGDTAHDFTLARVAAVQPSFIGITVSQAEIHNAFVAGVFGRFGDTGDFREEVDPNNPTGQGEVKAHDPDYGSTWAQVSPQGLRIHMEYSASVENWCDPRVHVEGTYVLGIQEVAEDEWSVVATRNPALSSVSFDFPWYCDAVPLVGLLSNLAAGVADAEVMASVDEAANDIAAGLCGTSCDQLIVSTLDGEIRIQAPGAFPIVQIDVPYEPRGARFPSPYGLPIAAGETVAIAAQNLGSGCDAAVWPNEPCFGQAIGPSGVPNRNAQATMPIPSEPSSVERTEARLELRTLARAPADLPRPDRPIGELLGKLASSGTTAPLTVGTGPCTFTAAAGDLLGLGPNDRTTTDGRVLGKGLRRVSVVFDPLASIPPCD